MALVQYHPALNRPDRVVCSVCIANYNGAPWLPDCIASVLAQQEAVSLEILVHDDASTDDSVAWLRDHHPQIAVLASSENVGFCIANHRMVEHARGQYVLLLNNDAALLPGALAALLHEISTLQTTGIVTLPQYDWATGALVDRGCLLDPFYNPVPNLDGSRREVGMAIGACLFLSRALWIELGGFPIWMESIAEDMYLCCMARLHGCPVRVTAESGYRHRQGASFGGNRVAAGRLRSTYRRRFLSERNKTATMIVCTPTGWVWPLLLLHVLWLSLEGAILCLCRWDVRVWRDIYGQAMRSMVSNRKHLNRTRGKVQRARRASLRSYLRMFVPMPRKLIMFMRYGIPELR